MRFPKKPKITRGMKTIEKIEKENIGNIKFLKKKFCWTKKKSKNVE
jgi:hypothetical protein